MTRSRDIADQQKNLGGAVAPFVGAKNFLLNGSFDCWQRGTSIAAQQVSFNYTADRWGASSNTSGAATVSRQATGDTTNLPFIQYCARYQRTAGNTATGIQYFNQPIETINSIPLAGKTVTLSFYARAGANFSASGNVLTAQIISGTGTDQNYLGVWTGAATLATTNVTLTTTWQRFSVSATVGISATELTIPFTYTPTGTAGANDYYEVTGVQLEMGAQMTPFSRAGGSIGGELALCQRYYYRVSAGNNYTMYGICSTANTTNGNAGIAIPVTMRTAPTSVDSSAANTFFLQQGSAGAAYVFTSAPSFNAQIGSRNMGAIDLAVASGLTANTFYGIYSNNTTSSYIGFSAEL